MRKCLPADAVLGTLALEKTGRLEVSLAAQRAVREIASAPYLRRSAESPAPAGGWWLVTTPETSAGLEADRAFAVRRMERFCLRGEQRVLLRVKEVSDPSPAESRLPPTVAVNQQAMSRNDPLRRPEWSLVRPHRRS